MALTTKLLIEDKQPKDISGCKPGVREHLAHGILEFNTEMFEILPATQFTNGNLNDLRKQIFAAGRVPANATILDFLLENQNLPEVESLLTPLKMKNGYPMHLAFLGTTYWSLMRHCAGEIRKLCYYDEYGWVGNTPSCLDGDNVCGIDYVVLLK